MTFPMTAWATNERDIVTLSAPIELTRLVDGGCSCVELEYSPIPDPACPLHGNEEWWIKD